MASLLISNESLADNRIYKIRIVKRVFKKEARVEKVIYYKVKPGDTLYKILKKLKVPPKKLSLVVKINKIKNPDLIYAGQKLKIPFREKLSRLHFKVRGKNKDLSPLMKSLGVQVLNSGFILLNSGTVDFSETPKISVGNRSFILDMGNRIGGDQEEELKSIGIGVLRGNDELREVIESQLISSFGSYDSNGTLKFGSMDRLIYRYDYSVFDESSGTLKVFNLKADTPYFLRMLLKSYGVLVKQPEGLEEKGYVGKLKVLSGNSIGKVAEFVNLITGSSGVYNNGLFVFRDLKLFIAPENADFEKISDYKMRGFKIAIVSEDFLSNVKKLLEILAIPYEKIKLVVVEPPGTSGERSKFSLKGLMVHARDRDWFMVDSVEKMEEIPYLRSRGVNLIFY